MGAITWVVVGRNLPPGEVSTNTSCDLIFRTSLIWNRLIDTFFSGLTHIDALGHPEYLKPEKNDPPQNAGHLRPTMLNRADA